MSRTFYIDRIKVFGATGLANIEVEINSWITANSVQYPVSIVDITIRHAPATQFVLGYVRWREPVEYPDQ